MTKAEAIKVMDAVANFKYCMNDTPITMAMVSAAAAVAAKALRRSLNATKRAKKNAVRRRKEARSEEAANATASIARARSLSLGEWFAKNQGCAS